MKLHSNFSQIDDIPWGKVSKEQNQPCMMRYWRNRSLETKILNPISWWSHDHDHALASLVITHQSCMSVLHIGLNYIAWCKMALTKIWILEHYKHEHLLTQIDCKSLRHENVWVESVIFLEQWKNGFLFIEFPKFSLVCFIVAICL